MGRYIVTLELEDSVCADTYEVLCETACVFQNDIRQSLRPLVFVLRGVPID